LDCNKIGFFQHERNFSYTKKQHSCFVQYKYYTIFYLELDKHISFPPYPGRAPAPCKAEGHKGGLFAQAILCAKEDAVQMVQAAHGHSHIQPSLRNCFLYEKPLSFSLKISRDPELTDLISADRSQS
jgi:hypothetical protein